MLKRFIQKTDMCLFEDIESMENAKSPVKVKRSRKVLYRVAMVEKVA